MGWQQSAKNAASSLAESAADLYNKYVDPMVGDIDWHLPDLTEDVPITFVERAPARKAPARPAPPKKKIDVYHGTRVRLKPENKIRYKTSGAEAFTEQPADRLPAGTELIESLPLGRFRTDKIGTGTGAQMYGHGLYFSEAPEVARGYRNAHGNPTIGGEDAFRFYNQIAEQANKAPIDEARPLFDRLGLLDDLLGHGDALAVHQYAKEGMYNPEAMNWFQREIEPKFDAPGALYHAQLDTRPEELLGWNDLLHEQPLLMNNIAPLLQKYDLNSGLHLDPNDKYPDTGADLYHMLRTRIERKSPELTANELVGANVPGIRYTETGTPGVRGAENYVIMNPDLIEILKRYRDGGAVFEG